MKPIQNSFVNYAIEIIEKKPCICSQSAKQLIDVLNRGNSDLNETNSFVYRRIEFVNREGERVALKVRKLSNLNCFGEILSALEAARGNTLPRIKTLHQAQLLLSMAAVQEDKGASLNDEGACLHVIEELLPSYSLLTLCSPQLGGIRDALKILLPMPFNGEVASVEESHPIPFKYEAQHQYKACILDLSNPADYKVTQKIHYLFQIKLGNASAETVLIGEAVLLLTYRMVDKKAHIAIEISRPKRVPNEALMKSYTENHPLLRTANFAANLFVSAFEIAKPLKKQIAENSTLHVIERPI